MLKVQTLVEKKVAAALAVVVAGSLLLGASAAFAAHLINPDTDNDGFISVVEGIPFYGGIANSLTVTGDDSPASALALDRFPVADKKGQIKYSRTLLNPGVDDIETLHIVIHGADIDGNGIYDGDKPSSLTDTVPFEATVPVACGELVMNGNSHTYQAKINELNSSGVTGHLEVRVDGDNLVIKHNTKGLSPNIAHAQHFHVGGGNVCPPNTVGLSQY